MRSCKHSHSREPRAFPTRPAYPSNEGGVSSFLSCSLLSTPSPGGPWGGGPPGGLGSASTVPCYPFLTLGADRPLHLHLIISHLATGGWPCGGHVTGAGTFQILSAGKLDLGLRDSGAHISPRQAHINCGCVEAVPPTPLRSGLQTELGRGKAQPAEVQTGGSQLQPSPTGWPAPLTCAPRNTGTLTMSPPSPGGCSLVLFSVSHIQKVPINPLLLLEHSQRHSSAFCLGTSASPGCVFNVL